MKHVIARKFVRWDAKPLESMRRERIYKLAMKVALHKTITREDKNEITRLVRGGAKLGGWQFFFPNVQQYYLEYEYEDGYEHVQKVLGCDKTSVRSVYKDMGRITHIQEKV